MLVTLNSSSWKKLVARSKSIPPIPLITSQPGRLHSPLCCLSLQGWLSSAWLTARGGVVQSAVCPRPMGESARLLAEASVGKNAERVSHELGACDLSINTAGVWQWESRFALRSATPHTLVYSYDSLPTISHIADKRDLHTVLWPSRDLGYTPVLGHALSPKSLSLF